MKNVKLQNIILPMDLDANFLSYAALMAKDQYNENPFCFDPEKKCHILKKYTTADMMTYYNCIQTKRWKKYTCIDNIKLNLKFKGKIALEIYEIYTNSTNMCFNLLINKVYSSKSVSNAVIEIPDTDKNLVGFKITALEDTEVYGGYYSSDVMEENIRDINISLVTTTFKKQEYIKRNIELLKNQVIYEGSELKNHIFVHVIDNESALECAEFDCEDLKVYPNKNVGGSGGFTRGMIEAMHLENKPTHILLMDDDVMIMSESLFRTYYLLRLLKPEYQKCFLSGAMFDYDNREKQYEDVGFVHSMDGSYGPVKKQMDMTLLKNVLKNDLYDYDDVPDAYAGWWYCCIPIEHIDDNGLPLPVFVRGDDVEFSLRNNPGFITLDGICIWHVGFTGKFNAAMELYQVHRNSLVIQAASGICKDINFLGRIKKMFWQELTRFAYNNAELLLDSIEDYLKGPKFIENLNGEKSLKVHCAKNEKLVPFSQLPYPVRDKDLSDEQPSMSLINKFIYVITVNGHLLPDFLLGNTPSIIPYDWIVIPSKNFRKKKLIAVNKNNGTGIVRTIDRKRCFELIKRYFKVMNKYKLIHVQVESAYRKHFKRMTSEEFWKEYLGI